MKKLARIFAVITTTAFLFGTVACGGAADKAKDASDEAAGSDDGAGKKGLEKFEGNRMEKADEEE
ncbi:MAG: hypothetical protein KC731_25550 [Myxococcales bacterium]|nr:hypothetical protein [Myxococcales bacterium]